MVRVWRRLRAEGLEARLILQVHDELIVEAPAAEAEKVRALVKEEMESAEEGVDHRPVPGDGGQHPQFDLAVIGVHQQAQTKSGYSTDAEVLESLASHHPVIPKILDYRKYAKLLSTYVEGLKETVGPDGRIRTTFNQTETRSPAVPPRRRPASPGR